MEHKGKGKLYIDGCEICEISDLNIEFEPVCKYQEITFKSKETIMSVATAFSRFNKMMMAVSVAMQKTPGLLRAGALDQLGGYKSRGKGKGVPGKNYFKSDRMGWGHSHVCGPKQCARYLRQGQHMTVVNGFEIMNRMSTKDLSK